MRTTLSILIVLALSVAASAQKLDEREAKKLVEEYVSSATADARRTEIVTRLRTGAPVLAQKPLKAALADEAKRPYALDCAIALRVPGLWAEAKKHIDSDEERVVHYGLFMMDKAAAGDLFDRWKSAEPDSATFGFVQGGFEKFPVALDVIKKFKDALKGDRKEHAARIVKFQLGAEVDEAATLLSTWDGLEAAYKADAKDFVLKGRDLTSLPGYSNSGAVSVGRNFRMKENACISIPLGDEWQSGNFTVIVRARAVDGELQRVGLHVGPGAWMAVHRKGEWGITTGDNTRLTADYKLGDWVEFRFELKDESNDTAKLVRKADVYVGTKKLVSGGITNGQVRKVEIQAQGGSMVVGGLEIIR